MQFIRSSIAVMLFLGTVAALVTACRKTGKLEPAWENAVYDVRFMSTSNAFVMDSTPYPIAIELVADSIRFKDTIERALDTTLKGIPGGAFVSLRSTGLIFPGENPRLKVQIIWDTDGSASDIYPIANEAYAEAVLPE